MLSFHLALLAGPIPLLQPLGFVAVKIVLREFRQRIKRIRSKRALFVRMDNVQAP